MILEVCHTKKGMSHLERFVTLRRVCQSVTLSFACNVENETFMVYFQTLCHLRHIYHCWEKGRKQRKPSISFSIKEVFFCPPAQFMVCLSFFCPIIAVQIVMPPASRLLECRRPNLGLFGLFGILIICSDSSPFFRLKNPQAAYKKDASVPRCRSRSVLLSHIKCSIKEFSPSFRTCWFPFLRCYEVQPTRNWNGLSPFTTWIKTDTLPNRKYWMSWLQYTN